MMATTPTSTKRNPRKRRGSSSGYQPRTSNFPNGSTPSKHGPPAQEEGSQPRPMNPEQKNTFLRRGRLLIPALHEEWLEKAGDLSEAAHLATQGMRIAQRSADYKNMQKYGELAGALLNQLMLVLNDGPKHDFPSLVTAICCLQWSNCPLLKLMLLLNGALAILEVQEQQEEKKFPDLWASLIVPHCRIRAILRLKPDLPDKPDLNERVLNTTGDHDLYRAALVKITMILAQISELCKNKGPVADVGRLENVLLGWFKSSAPLLQSNRFVPADYEAIVSLILPYFTCLNLLYRVPRGSARSKAVLVSASFTAGFLRTMKDEQALGSLPVYEVDDVVYALENLSIARHLKGVDQDLDDLEGVLKTWQETQLYAQQALVDWQGDLAMPEPLSEPLVFSEMTATEREMFGPPLREEWCRLTIWGLESTSPRPMSINHVG